MKKRILSMLLTATMACSMLPVTAQAAGTDSFGEANMTWIGTQTEYQKTLENMFVDGMRKMKAGDKWGIVDATGDWVAPPIYDKIELEYLVEMTGGDIPRPTVVNSNALEVLFSGGYTQCVRGGKMGLLNAYGEEAIPAQYDAVGLPSEGICRIIKKSGNTAYIGYWSLELGRELVAPNKFVTTNASAMGSPMTRQMLDRSGALDSLMMSIDNKVVPLPNGNRVAAEHDFVDGYAFVNIGQGSSGLVYGTILDKTGKDILPGGPYPYRPGSYPQFGPYMVYVKQSDKSYSSDRGDLGTPYLSGVVGPEGVIIPAQYMGGVRAPKTGWETGDARMSVIPELKLVITAKDIRPGKENGARVGVVNFQNKTVVPFTHDFNFFDYNPAHKVFFGIADNGSRMYSANGKRLNNKDYFDVGYDGSFAMINGFADVVTHTASTVNGVYQSSVARGFINLKTGADFFPSILDPDGNAGPANSNFSSNGLVWVQNPARKWGLLDGTGKIVLPYQYDAVVSGDAWTRAENGYAIVNLGQKQGIISSAGKQIAPFEYDRLYVLTAKGPPDAEYVEATQDGKVGLLSVITGKLVIPCIYEGIGGSDAVQYNASYFPFGVNAVATGNMLFCLVDKNGNKIPSSDYKGINTPVRGLFSNLDRAYIGAEGKIVFPETLNYSGRKNSVSEDTTLVVRDGKVGYINADLLAKPTAPKTLSPAKATAAPSSMNLIVDGKSVAVESYNIGGNNYVKIRDMAYLLNGTGKSFGVAWNGAKKAIDLKSNTAYTTVAGDMSKGDGAAKTAARASSPIYVDGIQRRLTAYAIKGNNFFKLRDVMKVFDVSVGFDGGTVTVDSANGYELTDAEQSSITPPSTDPVAPPASQVNKLEIVKFPELEFYMTGNHTFTTAGFELRYWDDKGVPTIITDTNEMVFTVDGNIIEDGYVFTVSSMKKGTVGYNGLTAPLRFAVYKGAEAPKIDDGESATEKQLVEGNYTISCLGNTFGMSNGWMVLDSKNPYTFGVEKDGDFYYIYFDEVTRRNYIGVSIVNGQLASNSKTKWKITNLGGNTYSARIYNELDRVVNASGGKSKDGTPIIVYKHTDTPKNAILTFTPAT